MIERKIGEVFEHEGMTLKCVKSPIDEKAPTNVCPLCAFYKNGICDEINCSPHEREDDEGIIFVKDEPKRHYFFVSFAMLGGFGLDYVSINTPFHACEVSQELSEKYGKECVVLYYKEISKEEYELNTK